MAIQNIFGFERRIDEMFEVLYPLAPRGKSGHPSGRAYKPIIESAIGDLVPGGNTTRQLQTNREYFKVDFQDFIEYATSELPSEPCLSHFEDQTAVFYESLHRTGEHRRVDATCMLSGQRYGLSILDAVVARNQVFVTVMMRFAGLTLNHDYVGSQNAASVGSVIRTPEGRIAECGSTLIFAPGSYKGKDDEAGPLGEWERCMWFPPEPNDPEWRFLNSGEYTSFLLDEMAGDPDSPCTREQLAYHREQYDSNYSRYGAFFEICRLGLKLPSYLDFMYDLVVTEKRHVGDRTSKKKRKGSAWHRPVRVPVYKLIRSVRVIRPDQERALDSVNRNWTAPSYSFVVKGHWRSFSDPTQVGRDESGQPIAGRTWVREFLKYKDKVLPEFASELRTNDPKVVIGIKQTLAFARDLIRVHTNNASVNRDIDREEPPSAEWIATERAKLTAGLRYLILRRDEFRCCLCGANAKQDNYVRLEVDHKIPVSKRGRTVEDNLHTVCRACNRGKSDSSM